MSDESDPNPTRPLENSEDTIIIEEQRLQQLAAEQAANNAHKQSSTMTLGQEQRNELPMLTLHPYGLRFDGPTQFITLPIKHEEITPRWLIELQMGAGHPPLGIEVAGDVIMGIHRGSQDPPDLDLRPYGADEKGVSRRHALLRPSRNSLYLIDLESTNGTRVNAMPVGYGIASNLRSYDAISLAALSFTLRILATPAEIDAARAAQQAANPKPDQPEEKEKKKE